MSTTIGALQREVVHPIHVHVQPALTRRNRLTTAFRFILAIPHLLLVGGPMIAFWAWSEGSEGVTEHGWTFSGGALGGVAVAVAIIAWFAIVFTGRYPAGLRSLAVLYL